MIIVALRLAGNIETSLIAVQDVLFSRDALVSARLFPPLIPVMAVDPAAITGTTVSRLLAALDRVRHHGPVDLLPGVPGDGAEAEQRLPPSLSGPFAGVTGYTVGLRGFSPLQEALSDELTRIFGGHAVEKAATPQVVLAWERRFDVNTDVPAPPEFPATRALWMVAYVVESASTHSRGWWDGALWQECFNRRLTVRDHPPLEQ